MASILPVVVESVFISAVVLREEGLYELPGPEGPEIFQSARRRRCSGAECSIPWRSGRPRPLLRSVQLRQDEACDADLVLEHPCLGDGVLAGRRVQDEEDLVRRAGELPSHDPPHLLQLLHQVDLCVEPSRGVDDHNPRPAGLRGADGVIDDGGGVGVRRLADQRDIYPLCPRLELFDGRRTEGVRGDERHRMPLRFQLMGQLSDRRGLSRTVHPDDHDRIDLSRRNPEGGLVLQEDLPHRLPEDFPEDLRAAEFLPSHPFLQRRDEFPGEGRPHVGDDEGLFQFIEERLIDLLAPQDDVVDIRKKEFPGLGEPRFQPVEEALFCVLLFHYSSP